MKVSEEAVEDALINPFSRMFILFFGTWLIGSLHHAPETLFELVTGRVHGYSNWIWVPGWFDFTFLPVIGCIFSKTVLVSGPVAIFCITCSALDRWNWVKVTALSSFSTVSMKILDSWGYHYSWITLTLLQATVVALLVLFIRPHHQS